MQMILWDRPEMTADQVDGMLKQPIGPVNEWLWRRMAERLPAGKLWSVVDKDWLYAQFPKLKIWNKLIEPRAQELFADRYMSV